MMSTQVTVIVAMVRARIEAIRADEHGYSTETVLVTALLVAGAIAVLAIIVRAVVSKANEISDKL